MSRNVGRLARCVLVMFGLALAGGCLQIDEMLTINRDGSGVYRLSYGMAESTLAQMEGVKKLTLEMDTVQGKKPPPDAKPDFTNPFLFDEQAIRNIIKPYEKSGIGLESVTVETREGWKYANVHLTFKRITDLELASQLGDIGLSLKRTADGNYILTQRVINGIESLDWSDPEIAAVMAGFKVRVVVEVPGRIVGTNAMKRREHTVTWDINFDQEPRDMSRFQKEGMYVMFEGKGVDLPEIKESPAAAVSESSAPAAPATPTPAAPAKPSARP
jgi:hypothetical protein